MKKPRFGERKSVSKGTGSEGVASQKPLSPSEASQMALQWVRAGNVRDSGAGVRAQPSAL